MYLKTATNGTNVSKCFLIYFWTPCYRPNGHEDPSNGMRERTPIRMSYGAVIGQTSHILQAVIEIWGLFGWSPILGLLYPPR